MSRLHIHFHYKGKGRREIFSFTRNRTQLVNKESTQSVARNFVIHLQSVGRGVREVKRKKNLFSENLILAVALSPVLKG